MRGWLIVPILALAACGGEPAGDNTGDPIGTGPMLPSIPEPAPGDGPQPEAAIPGIAAPPSDTAVTPAQTSDEEPRGELAAAVVRTYFANVGAGRYRDAYRMWDNGGRASGTDLSGFTGAFVPYASYAATIGTPGRVEAGAGQRYVSVPVEIAGTLRDGGAGFTRSGTVKLHRTGVIDGATAEQRRWRIASVELGEETPVPPAVEEGPATASAVYRCEDGSRLSADFDNRADTVALRIGDDAIVTLDQQVAASGIWYRGGGTELRGKGDQATLVRADRPPLRCTAE